MSFISDQIEDVIKKYPTLHIEQDNESEYILSGMVELNSEYADVPLYDTYDISIHIPKIFPKAIPLVFENGDDIPKGFTHFYSNGELCLGAICDLIDYLNIHECAVDFIDDIIMSYLYSASYYKRYKVVPPFGERSHGVKGLIEAYTERYNAPNIQVLVELLLIVAGERTYRGHKLCFCGSGKKFRNCHGKKVLDDIKSRYYVYYQNDAINVLNCIGD